MEVFYSWKTIEAESFIKQTLFRFGSESSAHLDNWNAIHEDLMIKTTVSLSNPNTEIEKYLFPGETYAMVFTWKGDNKFGGSTQYFDFKVNEPFELTQVIPKGSCAVKLEAELSLVVKEPSTDETGEWYRPPGSIISTIPIIEKVTIDKGMWFPIEEIDGDGSILLHWDFANIEDLDLSVSSCFQILFDKKHSMAVILTNTPEGQSLLTLMIIQGLARKALVDEVYEKLINKQDQGESWQFGSGGACFDFILKRLISASGVKSYHELKAIFTECPEKIDEIVDRIFSTNLISNFRK